MAVLQESAMIGLIDKEGYAWVVEGGDVFRGGSSNIARAPAVTLASGDSLEFIQ
jgi:hypothetical protein